MHIYPLTRCISLHNLPLSPIPYLSSRRRSECPQVSDNDRLRHAPYSIPPLINLPHLSLTLINPLHLSWTLINPPHLSWTLINPLHLSWTLINPPIHPLLLPTLRNPSPDSPAHNKPAPLSTASHSIDDGPAAFAQIVSKETPTNSMNAGNTNFRFPTC